jgi:cyclic pyranopterin phosphate synthase
VLTRVAAEFSIDQEKSRIECVVTAETLGRTGVEMEALTAVSVACLTIYDMVKAVEKSMRIEGIRLILKDGGKSGRFEVSE